MWLRSKQIAATLEESGFLEHQGAMEALPLDIFTAAQTELFLQLLP